MNLTMTFDPSDNGDLDRAEAVLAALRQPELRLEDQPSLGPGKRRPLGTVIDKITDPAKYGENRLGYLRRVAKAGSEGVAVSELLEQHFGGSYNAFGGTHSSIERSWKAHGGTEWAEQVISEIHERHVMYAPAIPMVLGLLDKPPVG